MTDEELFEAVTEACALGAFGRAMAAADELCRPERAKRCSDLLAPAKAWPAMRRFTPEQLQGLEDRIEQYNSYVRV